MSKIGLHNCLIASLRRFVTQEDCESACTTSRHTNGRSNSVYAVQASCYVKTLIVRPASDRMLLQIKSVEVNFAPVMFQRRVSFDFIPTRHQSGQATRSFRGRKHLERLLLSLLTSSARASSLQQKSVSDIQDNVVLQIEEGADELTKDAALSEQRRAMARLRAHLLAQEATIANMRATIDRLETATQHLAEAAYLGDTLDAAEIETDDDAANELDEQLSSADETEDR